MYVLSTFKYSLTGGGGRSLTVSEIQRPNDPEIPPVINATNMGGDTFQNFVIQIRSEKIRSLE